MLRMTLKQVSDHSKLFEKIVENGDLKELEYFFQSVKQANSELLCVPENKHYVQLSKLKITNLLQLKIAKEEINTEVSPYPVQHRYYIISACKYFYTKIYETYDHFQHKIFELSKPVIGEKINQ